MCCMLKSVSVCCSVLQCVAVRCCAHLLESERQKLLHNLQYVLQYVLQRVLQYFAARICSVRSARVYYTGCSMCCSVCCSMCCSVCFGMLHTVLQCVFARVGCQRLLHSLQRLLHSLQDAKDYYTVCNVCRSVCCSML